MNIPMKIYFGFQKKQDGNLGSHHDDTFHNDVHKTLKADYILFNPPFNISDWGGDKLTEDVRWKYGTPPEGNANYAWLQHMVYHLAPNGCAGIVLANGALSSNTSNEGEIRKNLVDAIVALPDKLFYSTGIPVSLWILNRNKKDNSKFRSREDEILFMDARNLGEMVESEMGMIPKVWECKQLKEHIKFIRGKKPKIISDNIFENSEVYLTIDVLNRNSVQYAINNKVVLATKMDILMVMDGASSGTLYYDIDGIIGSTLAKIATDSELINTDVLYFF